MVSVATVLGGAKQDSNTFSSGQDRSDAMGQKETRLIGAKRSCGLTTGSYASSSIAVRS